ncbi:MAG: class I tRNA ligase family protein, partial [Oscillospiraceae bacterium]|nr:class I tRNA ligase family protein [Oscillospiraceae bacterium]
FRSLVPCRLTGNIEWGVPAPAVEGLDGLTIWVWPESLWAPISFTQTLLESRGAGPDEWKRWWCGRGARVYQFIGQDNLYFYGPAQAAMFMGMQGGEPSALPAEGQLVMSDLIANNHVLFLDRKASSSAEIKPPTARELLDYYTPEQLRAHFLGLGLGIRSVSFRPGPLNPDAKPGESDPALKEGSLLTNVLNRVARSCFYTAQKYTGGRLPDIAPSAEAAETAAAAALDYEALMSRCEFHQVMNLLDNYIRGINKYWSKSMKEADAADDGDMRMRVLADCLHMTRTAAVLVHPVAPRGAELLAEYLNMTGDFFDWAHIFEPLSFFVADSGEHRLKFIEPRFDFFPRHESQRE